MRTTLMVLGALMAGMPVLAQTKPQGEEAAVRQVVESYLHGLKFNDVEGLKKAFWPEAKLFFVGKGGKLGELTQETWYKGFAASAGKEEQGDLRITAVEVTNNAASVKVVEDYPGTPPTRYTDYLSLLKLEGRWWIVNKIYTMERMQGAASQ